MACVFSPQSSALVETRQQPVVAMLRNSVPRQEERRRIRFDLDTTKLPDIKLMRILLKAADTLHMYAVMGDVVSIEVTNLYCEHQKQHLVRYKLRPNSSKIALADTCIVCNEAQCDSLRVLGVSFGCLPSLIAAALYSIAKNAVHQNEYHCREFQAAYMNIVFTHDDRTWTASLYTVLGKAKLFLHFFMYQK